MDIRSFLRGLLPQRRGLILALGGGGARGLAHLGVLEILEREHIPVVGIAGSSAGALVAAMWLTLGGAAPAVQRWREFLASDFPDSLPDVRLSERVSTRDNILLHYARRLRRGAAVVMALERLNLVPTAEFERALGFLLPDGRIERLRIPFCAVATDYRSGRPVALRHGPLLAAVAASSAVPGVISPYRLEDRSLLDGGVVADVPVRQARKLGNRPVVAVAVGEALGPDPPDSLTVPRALLRAGIMTHGALRAEALSGADLTLEPDVGELHWSDFRRLEDAVAAGRAAAEARLGKLRRLAGRTDVRRDTPTDP